MESLDLALVIMTERADLKEMRDCKVIPGEEVIPRHQVLYEVMRQKEEKQEKDQRKVD